MGNLATCAAAAVCTNGISLALQFCLPVWQSTSQRHALADARPQQRSLKLDARSGRFSEVKNPVQDILELSQAEPPRDQCGGGTQVTVT